MDVLLEMDKVVGSLISLREENPENTIIIFASDNGGLGRRKGMWGIPEMVTYDLRGSKGMVYEGGHRIPLIVRYDEYFPANEERSHIVSLVDMYATIYDLIRIDVPYRYLSAQDSAEYINDESKQDELRQDL